MKRKNMLYLLVFLFLFTSSHLVLARTEGDEISSLEKSQWLVDQGWVIGRGDNKGYSLNEPITRAELTKLLVLGLDLELPDEIEEDSFSDVGEGHWSYAYIEAAVKAGLVKGYPDRSFKPEQQITYIESIAMISRLHRDWDSSFDESGIWPDTYISFAKEHDLLEDLAFSDESLEDWSIRGPVFEMIYNALYEEVEGEQDISSQKVLSKQDGLNKFHKIDDLDDEIKDDSSEEAIEPMTPELLSKWQALEETVQVAESLLPENDEGKLFVLRFQEAIEDAKVVLNAETQQEEDLEKSKASLTKAIEVFKSEVVRDSAREALGREISKARTLLETESEIEGEALNQALLKAETTYEDFNGTEKAYNSEREQLSLAIAKFNKALCKVAREDLSHTIDQAVQIDNRLEGLTKRIVDYDTVEFRSLKAVIREAKSVRDKDPLYEDPQLYRQAQVQLEEEMESFKESREAHCKTIALYLSRRRQALKTLNQFSEKYSSIINAFRYELAENLQKAEALEEAENITVTSFIEKIHKFCQELDTIEAKYIALYQEAKENDGDKGE